MDLNELLARHQGASYFEVNAPSSDDRRSARRDTSLFGAEIRLLRLALDLTVPLIWDRTPAACAHGRAGRPAKVLSR